MIKKIQCETEKKKRETSKDVTLYVDFHIHETKNKVSDQLTGRPDKMKVRYKTEVR